MMLAAATATPFTVLVDNTAMASDALLMHYRSTTVVCATTAAAMVAASAANEALTILPWPNAVANNAVIQ